MPPFLFFPVMFMSSRVFLSDRSMFCVAYSLHQESPLSFLTLLIILRTRRKVGLFSIINSFYSVMWPQTRVLLRLCPIMLFFVVDPNYGGTTAKEGEGGDSWEGRAKRRGKNLWRRTWAAFAVQLFSSQSAQH
jgi:hypothetical protein